MGSSRKRVIKRTPNRTRKVKQSASSAARATPEIGEIYTGVFQGGARRGGFVVLESPGLRDVFVPDDSCATALHGDQVRVTVLRDRHGRAPEGRIERVLRHANRRIVGRLRRSGRISVVSPKSKKINRLIEIHRRFTQDEVPDGAWVVVEIRRWSESPHDPLVGSLVEVLGTEQDERLPILLLIREGGIEAEFPAEVQAEAEKIALRKTAPAEIARRRDFRDARVMTIDPATAKDFDDAISLVGAGGDGWRIAVHIADVAHYVRSGSDVDEEAYDRGTSIYPIDRVIPMLPEQLSNDVCSLRPDRTRLTVTVIFSVDAKGKVRDVELCESVIRSARRFSYEEVQGLFDEADGAQDSHHHPPSVDDALRADLFQIRQASSALLSERMRRGALDLDLPETEILFDSKGMVADVRRKERMESHRLIEDLMIAANEAVARELTRNSRPLLYRVHEPPAEASLAALAPALARFGIGLPGGGTLTQSGLQAALSKASRHPAGAIVQRWVLRAMMRARYQGRNVGHFGLASPCYAHFTSPIRRYPDLLVHRAVKALLGSRDARGSDIEGDADRLEEWGKHISQREERAQRIEWDAEKILTLEFMRRFLGDVFDGFISGVANRGLFVELIDYPAEGFVPIKTLEDDYFELDEDRIAFRGRRTGRVFAVGDRVRIQIERIDVLAGEMDLNLVRAQTAGAVKRKQAKGSGQPYPWKKQVKRRRRKR